MLSAYLAKRRKVGITETKGKDNLVSLFLQYTVLGVGGQALAVGRPLWEEARASPCQPQLVPEGSNGPTAGHSWAHQSRWGCLWESLFKKKKARKCQIGISWGRGLKWVKNSLVNSKRKEGGDVPGAGAEILLLPVEQVDVSGRNYSPWNTHIEAGLSWRTAAHWRTPLKHRKLWRRRNELTATSWTAPGWVRR